MIIRRWTVVLAALSLGLAVVSALGAFRDVYGRHLFMVSSARGEPHFAVDAPDPMGVTSSTGGKVFVPGGWLLDSREFAGVVVWRITDGSSTAWSVWMPYAYPCVIGVIFPLCVGCGVLRRVWRIRAGRCWRCGYDLRASPDQCPECGAACVGAGRAGSR